jgi:hypothetical protein
MNAKEARRIASSLSVNDHKKEIDEIIDKILVNVNKGLFFVHLYKNISFTVDQELKKMGYKINSYS